MTTRNKLDTRGQGDSPEIADIEEILRGIKPIPRKDFYQKMGSQPWNRTGFWSSLDVVSPRAIPITVLIALILVLIASFFSPSLEALANRIGQFFTPSTNNQVVIQIPSADLINPDLRFTLTLKEVREQADFRLKTPSLLPDGFHFSGATINPQRGGITLNYQSDRGLILRISQQPASKEYQEIRSLADIEMVSIGSSPGEYVSGGWKANVPTTASPSLTTTVTLEAVWDPGANIHFLRWEENDILYELLFIGDVREVQESLEKDDLILIAESLR